MTPPGPERLAVAGLLRVAAPSHDLAAAVAEHGVERIWARWCEEHSEGPGVDPAADFAAAAGVGARLVMPADTEWPAALGDLAIFTAGPGNAERRAAGRGHGVPFGLWLRGPSELGALAERSVALVGARAATSYGTWVAGELALGLGERAVSVVSGGAFGIDAAAHRGALAADGLSAAVLAGGIDVAYPLAHEALLDRIARTGLLIAEGPPGARPRREGFLVRNRLIAALTQGSVLVEAGLRSGARNTLAHAAALGRSRMVVPGPVSSALSAGCHTVLRDDLEARLVTCAAEVLEEVGRLGADLAEPRSGPSDARDALGPSARRLLEALPARAAVPAGVLAGELGTGMVEVLALAQPLVDLGFVTVAADGYRLTAAGRAPVRR